MLQAAPFLPYHFKYKHMNELLDRLQQQAGLTTEQAQKSLQTIKQFVVEKFPMLSGAVDNIFPDTAGASGPASGITATPLTDATSLGTTGTIGTSYHTGDTAAELHAIADGKHSGASTPPPAEKTFMDKISDFIPGQAGEKIEDFVKKAAQEADNLFKKKP